MTETQNAIERMIGDFKKIADSFGWLRSADGAIRLRALEAALLALLTRHFNRWRVPACTLRQVVDEIRTLPSFADLDEIDALLTILLFEFDREILVRTRELRTKTWATVDLAAQQARFPNGPEPPTEWTDIRGLSLVLSFEYADTDKNRVKQYLQPVSGRLWETPRHHFTIMNIGTKIPREQIAHVTALAKNDLERALERDFHLHILRQKLLNVSFALDPYLMPDASIVFFGSGEFLKCMHEFRLRVRDGVLPLDLESILESDVQPVWTHTVHSRPFDQITGPQGVQMLNCQLSGRVTVPAKLCFMIFKDPKAMLEPDMLCIEP